jgi:hypothetical protein
MITFRDVGWKGKGIERQNQTILGLPASNWQSVDFIIIANTSMRSHASKVL